MKMKMHPIQFGLIANLIQMKWMKVSDTLKSMMRQGFQHCYESRLIEVMKMKIHPIQFAVIANLIQMKWMKVSDTLKSMMNQEFQYHEEL
jgi:Mn-dependent DtxR family transcriptional regulator